NQSDAELDFATIRDRQREIIGSSYGLSEIMEDLEYHITIVNHAVFEVYSRVSISGQKLQAEQARFYMCYGAGRRVGMIREALISLCDTVPVGRTKPLNRDESGL